jgi:hypothetical protein
VKLLSADSNNGSAWSARPCFNSLRPCRNASVAVGTGVCPFSIARLNVRAVEEATVATDDEAMTEQASTTLKINLRDFIKISIVTCESNQ